VLIKANGTLTRTLLRGAVDAKSWTAAPVVTFSGSTRCTSAIAVCATVYNTRTSHTYASWCKRLPWYLNVRITI
jgi:hypothetical protein